MAEKLITIEKELRFRISILERELEDERNRKKVDFDDIDESLKMEYEKRCVACKPVPLLVLCCISVFAV